MTPLLDDLLDRYRSPLAARSYDEAVTELDHALQCADLAIRSGADDALVVAALLHDVGHLLEGERRPDGLPRDDLHHEDVGGRYLRRWFGPAVTAPVTLHVSAKRYLCAVDPDYLAQLSAGSVHSLGLQGGPMDDDERAAFEQRPGWEDAVQLRRWDDAAKVVGARPPSFDQHVPLLRSLADC